MTAPKPRLRIREGTQADVTTLVEIQLAAFGADIIDQLLYPSGITEDAKAKAAYWLFPPPDPKQTSEILLVVAELVPENGPAADRPGDIIAFAKWSLRRQPVPEEVWNVEPPLPLNMLGEGSNIEVYKWFHEALHRRLRELSPGDAALHLDVLVCTPHRQRLGAGSALVKWGTDLADNLGLVTWLEASPYGYPLYKRHGYEDISVMDFKTTETWGATKPEGRDWGENSALEIGGPLAEGELRAVFMRRLPKTSH